MTAITVLIIDDETSQRETLTQLIRSILTLPSNTAAITAQVEAPDTPSPDKAVQAVTQALGIAQSEAPAPHPPDLIVLDWKLDGAAATWNGTSISSGMDIFRHILAPLLLSTDGPRTKVVIVTGYKSQDETQTQKDLGPRYADELTAALAVDALYDFWKKPLNRTQIQSSLESLFDLPSRYEDDSAIRSYQDGLQNAVVTVQCSSSDAADSRGGPVNYRKAGDTRAISRFMGVSAFRRRIITQAKRLARTQRRYPILLRGATGTGKELVARMIHEFEHVVEQNGRGQLTFKETIDRFFAVNCAEFTDQLLQSQLFGHIKGAFTGATADKEGIFHRADGGTVFLDEIGESSIQFQAMLLRFLETQHVSRLGEEGVGKYVDVRITLATDRDLADEVRQQRMRPAFYHRIAAMEVELLPLCKRPEDIVPLAHFFWGDAYEAVHRGGKTTPTEYPFTPGAELELRRYAWPGNVRQLRGVIHSAVALAGREAAGLITRPHIQEALALTEGGKPKPAARIARMHEEATLEELRVIQRIAAILDPAYDVNEKQPPNVGRTLWKLAHEILGFDKNFPRKIGQFKELIERNRTEMPHLYGYVTYSKRT